uniref:hypothetical protein n=1 Tax=Prosthecobacter sp. TaxID=1965333 RepID=UPI0037838BB5
FLVFALGGVVSTLTLAQDQFPELTTIDGKVFKQVKVMKKSPTEIRIMHADGFATIPLSALPPEVRSKYGEANPEAEQAAAMQRKAEGYAAAVYQRQEKEAIRTAELSHQSIEVCRQAIVLRDWCLANLAGGMMNGQNLDQKTRDVNLAEALAVLARRPSTNEAVVMTPPGINAPGGASSTPETAPASTTSAAPTGIVGVFQPGIIELVSARYTLPGNLPRNVKNRLSKLIPTTVISAPVSILVSDSLSDAAKAQGDVTTTVGIGATATNAEATTIGTTTPQGNSASVTQVNGVTVGVAVVQSQTTEKNLLTVEYIYNGVRYKKQALEGTQLVLP